MRVLATAAGVMMLGPFLALPAPPASAATAAHAAIVGGTPAGEDTFPWLAFVGYESSDGSLSVCTGTVVAPNVVLTAGHCVENAQTGELDEPARYTVITGNVRWMASFRVLSGVSRTIVYPGFDRATLSGDAALLILSTPTTAPAITLASTASDAPILKAGTAGIVAGWGKSIPEQPAPTEVLQSAHTVVQQTGYCEHDAKPFDSEDELCAIDAPGDEAGICFGDSGAPLFARNPNGSGVVELGLASHLYGQCSTTHPAVYTRADTIAPWLDESIAAAAALLAPASRPVTPKRAPPERAARRHRRRNHRRHQKHKRHTRHRHARPARRGRP
jgi:secreted trypsin-like serine protease